MEELAKIEGEEELAERCRSLFEKGSASIDQELWNGEYYVQTYDRDAHKETQYGPGCHSDQLLGQWWAHQLDLGYILPEEHVRKALKSVYRYNYRKDMVGHVQKPRVYLKEEEGGLLICTWPKGGRPDPVTLYSDEVWTGIEYAVAGAMLFEGMVQEALDIVTMARTRHDGRLRSPWNDVECGDHYARAMSSWALLEAFSGFKYDVGRAMIMFSPVVESDEFRTFFITGGAWGRYEHGCENGRCTYVIRIDYGSLRLRELILPLPTAKAGEVRAYLGEDMLDGVELSHGKGVLKLKLEAKIDEGNVLKIVLKG
jgi:hypothetical protein